MLEMRAFVQLLSLKNALVVPAPWFNPPHIQIHVWEMSVVDLLEEVIQESTKLHRIILLEPIPSGPVAPHMLEYWSDESVRFLCCHFWIGLGQDVGVHAVGIFLPTLALVHAWLLWSVGLVGRLPSLPLGSRSSPGCDAFGAIPGSIGGIRSPSRRGFRDGRFCNSMLRENASPSSWGGPSLDLRGPWSG